MASNGLNVLKAIFILPFTAGLVKKRQTVGFSSHDGSISVCVILTTTIAIIIELMNNYIHHDFPLRILIIALLCIGILTLILCSFILSLCGTWRIEKEVKVSNRLKLFFLWMFCCGNIIYQVVDLVTEFECGVSSENSIYLPKRRNQSYHILQKSLVLYVPLVAWIMWYSYCCRASLSAIVASQRGHNNSIVDFI